MLTGHRLESKSRLSVTTTKCRLTCGEIVLESVELAEILVEYRHIQFRKRSYSDCYQLEIKLLTSTCTKATTKLKKKHSAEVKALLSG
ncbi:hypothetical protein C9J12_27380 [Photobacterium frigidiphilum]|uniref:Uncharacterized protein n=1 Tax=Photobacterium frigidiphilum TaxID=264736 RepID=A0A2T3J6V9_9GAMM|nr:hypothetical protein C9J12_27380 [Photobacterium frigidiphilum]